MLRLAILALLAVPFPARAGAMSACLEPLGDPTRVSMTATLKGYGVAGTMELTMADSPYGITVADDGRYVTDIRLSLGGFRPAADIVFVVWATTPGLDEIQRLGTFRDRTAVIEGRLGWNQFLVFVTAEADPDVARWEGPILLTGMSPSGKMHSKAGHGIYEAYSYLC